MMIKKITIVLLALCLTAAIVGCGSSASKADVTQYLGKSEEEIKELLGKPSGSGDSGPHARSQQMDRELMQQHFREKRLVYRSEVSTLTEPLMTLELIISKDGVCKQVLGQTSGFDTPEALLDAIGLGHLDKKVSSRDQLGVTYTIPPYSLFIGSGPPSVQYGAAIQEFQYCPLISALSILSDTSSH